MATIQSTFGAYLFSPASRCELTGWRERLLKHTTFTARELSEGAQISADQLEGREFQVQGYCAGTTKENARANLDGLLAALDNGVQYLTRYTDRRIPAYLSGPVSWGEKPGTALVYYEWDATLRSEQPFWEAVTATTNTFSKTGSGPYSLPLSASAGTAFTRCVIDITFNAAITNKTLALKNVNKGEILKVHGASALITNHIVIDFEARRITDASGNEVFPATIEGDWWTMNGNGTATTIELAHDAGGGANMGISVTFRDKFYVY